MQKLSTLLDQIAQKTDELEQALLKLLSAEDVTQEASAIRDTVLIKMSGLRLPCDEAERLTAKSRWPFPTYGDLLFSVD